LKKLHFFFKKMSISEDLPSNHRGFSFQSHDKDPPPSPKDQEFLEQFEEAIAERDQRISSLEEKLESFSQKEKDFISLISSYESKLLKLQSEIKSTVSFEETPQILKEIESHNKTLEELLSFCEKMDLKGLISFEKKCCDEDFLGIEALKKGYEDRLMRLSKEFDVKSNELTESLKKELNEKKGLITELKETREKTKVLALENNEIKQKNNELNNKIFELSVSLRSEKELKNSKNTKILKNKESFEEDFERNLTQNLTKSLIESIGSKISEKKGKNNDNEELIEGITEKIMEKMKKTQEKEGESEKIKGIISDLEENLRISEEKIRNSEENLKISEEKLKISQENLRDLEEKLRNSEEKLNISDKKLRNSEEIIKGLRENQMKFENSEEKEAEFRALRKIVEKNSKEIKEKASFYESDIGNLKENLLLSEKKIEDLARNLREKEVLLKKNDAFAMEKQLKEKALIYETEILDLKQKLLIFEEKNEDFFREIQRKNAEIASLAKEKTNLEKKSNEKLAFYEGEIANLKEKQSFSEEKESLNGFEKQEKQIELAFEAELLDLKERIDIFEVNKKELMKEIQVKEALNRSLLGEIANLNKKLAFSEEKKSFEEELGDLRVKNLDLMKEIEGFIKKNAELVKLLKEKEAIIKRILLEKTAILQEKNQLLEENASFREKFGEKQEEITSLSSQKELEKASFVNKNSVLLERIETYKTQIAFYKQENEDLRNVIEKYSEKIEFFEKEMKEMSVFREKITINDKNVKNLQEKIRVLTEEKENISMNLQEKIRILTEEKERNNKALDIKEENILQFLKENKKFKAVEEEKDRFLGQINEKNEIISKKNVNIEQLTKLIETKERLLSDALKENTGFSQEKAEFSQILKKKEEILLETLEEKARIQRKLFEFHESFREISSEIGKFKQNSKEIQTFIEKTHSEMRKLVENEIYRFFSEILKKNEEKMLLIQRIYDKKEAGYRGNYETQISRLEKDFEGFSKNFKEKDEESYLSEKPQKMSKPQPLSSFLQINPSTASNSITNNSTKSEFINYLAKKTSLKPKAFDKSPLFISQTQEFTNNTNKNLTFTPKSQQSSSFYLIGDSGSKKNLSEIYPPRNSWENTQKEVTDLKKSLNLLHEEHQKLLEVVESKDKSNKIGMNDGFAVKCFEKLFDQLAISLERESQLRIMAQLLDEKIAKSIADNHNVEEIREKLEEKEGIIANLEQENSQYRNLCKELQIQLDFKRAQMKFLQQNEGNGAQKDVKRLVEVKRDFSLTHHHERNEEPETIPNLSINFQRGGIKSPMTPHKIFSNKDLKNSSIKMDGSAKKSARGAGQKKWV